MTARIEIPETKLTEHDVRAWFSKKSLHTRMCRTERNQIQLYEDGVCACKAAKIRRLALAGLKEAKND